MITILDKTSNIFTEFMKQCEHTSGINLPFYVIKTYYHDDIYPYENDIRSHRRIISKMEFYDEIGFTECNDNNPDISYYIPFGSVYDGGSQRQQNHNLLNTYRQLFYECNNFDIVIGNGEDVKHIKNQIRIRTRIITPSNVKIDDVYLNGKLIPLVDNDLNSTIKCALRQCITEIMANSPNELESKLRDECKKLIIEQNNQFGSKIMQLFSLSDSTEIDLLRRENEELKEYKKSMDQIIGLYLNQTK